MEMRRRGLGDDERDRNERAKMRGLKRSREEGVEEHTCLGMKGRRR